jgi:hypothetical protein
MGDALPYQLDFETHEDVPAGSIFNGHEPGSNGPYANFVYVGYILDGEPTVYGSLPVFTVTGSHVIIYLYEYNETMVTPTPTIDPDSITPTPTPDGHTISGRVWFDGARDVLDTNTFWDDYTPDLIRDHDLLTATVTLYDAAGLRIKTDDPLVMQDLSQFYDSNKIVAFTRTEEKPITGDFIKDYFTVVEFAIENIPDGEYLLVVSKENHLNAYAISVVVNGDDFDLCEEFDVGTRLSQCYEVEELQIHNPGVDIEKVLCLWVGELASPLNNMTVVSEIIDLIDQNEVNLAWYTSCSDLTGRGFMDLQDQTFINKNWYRTPDVFKYGGP